MRISTPVQTVPVAHPASSTMGSGSLPGVKSGRGVTLTPHPFLLPWSRKSEALTLLLYEPQGLYRALVPVQGCTLSLTLCHKGGTQWHSWLMHCATNQKVMDSIPDGVNRIFYWHNPSGRTTALGSTQPLTEMSTRNISYGVKAASM